MIIVIIIVAIIYFLKNIIYGLVYKYKHNLKVQNLYSFLFIYNDIFIEKDYNFLDKIKFKNSGKNEIYFDVGGNNGIYSLYLNDKHKNIEVHVFEPIVDLYKNIRWNIGKNKKKNNTYFINNIGLGNKNENLTINFMPNADGLSTIKNDVNKKRDLIIDGYCSNNSICKFFMGLMLNKDRLKILKRDIKITTLSDYLMNKNIKFIDKIKVDIEGYELEFLQGITNEDFKKIGSIVLEVENYRENYTSNIINILKKNNFTVKFNNDNKKNNWIMIYGINNNYEYEITK